ncbi:CAZyme family CE10 [Penicillium atrosanguineum]|uniref:AAA+ ATPase domain-containing protein n=1 Tax=Penicillium atrosanguineum TaxID=1132637 RepID=A0A9W9QHH5_9EURO|nr:CAZyme family CE10 [Penicillium atrosanguineum]KAJ5313856.1 CAZyme family CE10 [Penicillium atrosanguineum]KAJ5331027.1 hypothetical protein N7476_000810 [Penicillium atrosanguineum]
MRHNAKRSLEEIVNKSDSDDEDWSGGDDRPARPTARKSKSSPQKKSRPSKKRQRRASDIVSDDDSLISSDELSSVAASESEEEDQDDPNIPRNARGTARRRTTQSRPLYEEPSDDEETPAGDEDEDSKSAMVPPSPLKSTIVKLKIPRAVLQDAQLYSRRITRRTRGASEDMYALTNSGHHMQTVERGTLSPEAQIGHGTRRSSRGSKQPVIHEESIETSVVQEGSLEILESDFPQSGAEGDTTMANDVDQGDVDMTHDSGVVPESENEDAKIEEDEDEDDEGPITRRRSRPTRNDHEEEPESEEKQGVEPSDRLRRSGRKKPSRSSQQKGEESDFEPEEGEGEEDEDDSDSVHSSGSPRKGSRALEEEESVVVGRRPGLRKRPERSRGTSYTADEAEELADELEDLKGSRKTRRQAVAEKVIYDKPTRTRKHVDYRLFRPEIMFNPEENDHDGATESPSRRGRGGGGGGWQRNLLPTFGPFGGAGQSSILGPHGAAATTGGVDSDSSDDEGQAKSTGLAPGGGILAPQGHAGDAQGLSGTPANFGKIKDKQSLADADPLGVDINVNFDSVGGLQGHIDQLKEMVSLPLLYPEIFQRFHITPPEVSCSMDLPGADALSKWVGEAERQLRLLFEEARKTQPSIIFFDEIDGLAPVRSSKQEQIHASIVSTLLALMDGMDGRGQVIVIGATNRPDSVDPALRRPGRFDREFYFPLPNLDGRRAILDIHTKGWDPALPKDIKDELAKITKGYGGADLRALCTEAALNAVQRKYPQIYKSDKKLIIDPKTIDVIPKDFMLAVKKMVPSSERSTASGASSLPQNVEPLLRQSLIQIETSLSEVLPQRKKLTALEEAQFEEPDDGNGFKREQMIQEFDRSRVFRPRLLLRGGYGMGQQYLAAALLHHFEGLHVQAFDLPTLLSDSTRSPEATVIQLFSEVKRHKPSVIYIPSVQTWAETVGPAVISTFLGLLQSIPASDPVLLLGVLESADDEMDPVLLKKMFGFSKKNLFDIQAPDHTARHEFFAKLVEYIKTPPADFPDPENRKKRQLEELEVAPPPPPQAEAQMSKEQLKAQKKKDRHILNCLKIRIQPIMEQLRKYKRFRSGVVDENTIRYLWEEEDPDIVTSDLPPDQQGFERPIEKAFDKHGVVGLRETATGRFFYNLDIVIIEKRLSNGYYKRPSDFLADVKRIAKDARQLGDAEKAMRANEMLANVEVDIANIDLTDPVLVAECENVYQRELAREKAAAERARTEQSQPSRPGTGNVPHGNTESGPSTGPVHLGVPSPDTQAAERPFTPTRESRVSFTNGNHNGYHNGGGSDLNENGPHAQSNGTHGDVDGDVFMSNSDDHSGSKDTVNSSFGPSAQPKPAYSHTAPSQQVRRESGLSSFSQKDPMTPMAPGSQPADYTNEASTTQSTSEKKSSEQLSNNHYQRSPQVSRLEYPDLTQYPDRISQEEHLPDTQQGGSSQPSPKYQADDNVTIHGSQSQSKPQPPLFGESAKPAANSSANLQQLLNEEPAPELILDLEHVDHLHDQLTQQTSGCSVEQLEQVATCLMDYIWRKRGEWDRTAVAKGLTDEFNAVLDDMQTMQEIGPISHNTKQQMGNPSYSL